MRDAPPSPPATKAPDAHEQASFRLLAQQRLAHGKRLKLGRLTFFRDALRFRGSVLLRILPTLFAITLWAFAIAVGNLHFGKHWHTSNAVIGPLSVVFGLLIVFRNGTSYDRWFEGAKDWQNTLSDVRSLARFMWYNIDLAVLSPPDSLSEEEREQWREERQERKKEAVRLLSLFLYATKHHLRQERSLSHGDYLGLLSPSLRKAYEHTLALGLLPPLSPPPSAAGAFGIAVQAQVDESAPLLASPSAAEETAQDEAARAEAEKVLEAAQAISLPVFVLSRLARYLAAARAAGCLKDAGQPSFAMVNQLLASLTTNLGNEERVATMTIPVVYGVHLKQATLLYLLSLPFVLVNELSWRMVPFVSLVSFTLIGLEGIASEIEQPFGYDPSDHNLDYHCAAVRHELECMMRAMPPSLEGVL